MTDDEQTFEACFGFTLISFSTSFLFQVNMHRPRSYLLPSLRAQSRRRGQLNPLLSCCCSNLSTQHLKLKSALIVIIGFYTAEQG